MWSKGAVYQSDDSLEMTGISQHLTKKETTVVCMSFGQEDFTGEDKILKTFYATIHLLSQCLVCLTL